MLSSRFTLFATAFLALTSHALPHPDPVVASYSVVNVDGGGNNPTSLMTPVTVIETVTAPSTPMVTEDATISFTVTDSLVAESTNVVIVPGQTPGFTVTAAQLSSSPTTTAITTDATVTVVSVSTATMATSSVSYYDNGMWHTSYAIKSSPTALPKWNSTTVPTREPDATHTEDFMRGHNLATATGI